MMRRFTYHITVTERVGTSEPLDAKKIGMPLVIKKHPYVGRKQIYGDGTFAPLRLMVASGSPVGA